MKTLVAPTRSIKAKRQAHLSRPWLLVGSAERVSEFMINLLQPALPDIVVNSSRWSRAKRNPMIRPEPSATTLEIDQLDHPVPQSGRHCHGEFIVGDDCYVD